MERLLIDKEIAALSCLSESDEPAGSWSLADKLEEKGLRVSSATMGRTLSNLERMGYVKKSGNSGRVITDAGIAALSNSILSYNIKKQTEKLEQTITTNVLEDYIYVLQARRAIERETASLAAQNATDEELEEMERMLINQRERHERDESVADTDIGFHQAIARASRNKVLEALYIMLFSYGQQTTIFEHIRKQVDAVYMTSHLSILQALKERDKVKAEARMVEHMESLIGDVRRFWDMFYSN